LASGDRLRFFVDKACALYILSSILILCSALSLCLPLCDSYLALFGPELGCEAERLLCRLYLWLSWFLLIPIDSFAWFTSMNSLDLIDWVLSFLISFLDD
jgi:hypothetical protein